MVLGLRVCFGMGGKMYCMELLGNISIFRDLCMGLLNNFWNNIEEKVLFFYCCILILE